MPIRDSLLNRLVASPCCLPALTEADLFAIYRRLGFSKFEAFSEWAACRHSYLDDPAVARARAQAAGFRITSYHLPALDENLEESLPRVLQAAKFAQGLGAQIVLFKVTRLDLLKAAGRKFLDGLQEGGLSLTPVLQNHAGSAISTLTDYKQAFDDLDHDPRMRAILEVGHFQRVGVHWKQGWECLRDRVALIHVNEIKEGKSVLYGSGEVDFGGLLKEVKTSGYAGDLVVELELENNQSIREETIRGLESALELLCRLYEEA